MGQIRKLMVKYKATKGHKPLTSFFLGKEQKEDNSNGSDPSFPHPYPG